MSLNCSNQLAKAITPISGQQPNSNAEVWIKKGKNLLNVYTFNYTTHGITINNTSDGKLAISGTTTQYSTIWLTSSFTATENCICSVTGSLTGSSVIVQMKRNGSNSYSWLHLNGLKLYAGDWIEFVYIQADAGTTIEGTIGLQIEKGHTITPYEKYFKEKSIYVRNANGNFEEFLPTIYPKRIYPTFDHTYIYESDLQYDCLQIGTTVILNFHTIAFKSNVGTNQLVLMSKLPKPKVYTIFYLTPNDPSTGGARFAINTNGDIVIHYGGVSLSGDAANRQYYGTLVYETTQL